MKKEEQTKKVKAPRKKKCKTCGVWFVPKRDFQITCGKIECAVAHGKKILKQTHSKTKKEYKQDDKKYLKAKAQQVFNKFIRLRDNNEPCISCGHKGDRQFHAGHFRPRGRNQALTFNEDNCHKQCSICNNHLSGNLIPYRVALIKKIGLKKVEELEATNESKSYSIEELKDIINKYKIKIKEIE